MTVDDEQLPPSKSTSDARKEPALSIIGTLSVTPRGTALPLQVAKSLQRAEGLGTPDNSLRSVIQ